jgi:triacylglycerol lipase
MKSTILSLLAGLLATGFSSARNPEPLRFRGSPGVPVAPGTAARKTVLVHGFMDTGSIFRQLRRHLEAQGVHCLVPELNPSDGRGGLENLARRLKADIDAQYGPDAPISIVAFSMGGLVSRHYLQNLGGAARCERLLTVASPHHGTWAAWLYPSQGAGDMRPGSRFLDGLGKTENRLHRMAVVSYRTPLDLVIVPSTSSVWDRAENIAHPALLHPLMLNSSTVIEDIGRRILE